METRKKIVVTKEQSVLYDCISADLETSLIVTVEVFVDWLLENKRVVVLLTVEKTW